GLRTSSGLVSSALAERGRTQGARPVNAADTEIGTDHERTAGANVEQLLTRTFVVPTYAHEADGTFSWDSTTVVLVEARAGGHAGVGYSYTAGAAAALVEELLAEAVVG